MRAPEEGQGLAGVRTPAQQRPRRPTKRVSPGGFCSPPSGRPELCTASANAGWMSVFLQFWAHALASCLESMSVGPEGSADTAPAGARARQTAGPRAGPGLRRFWALFSPDSIGRAHVCRRLERASSCGLSSPVAQRCVGLCGPVLAPPCPRQGTWGSALSFGLLISARTPGPAPTACHPTGPRELVLHAASLWEL